MFRSKIKRVKEKLLFCCDFIGTKLHHLIYYGLQYAIISHIPKIGLIGDIIPNKLAQNSEYFSIGSTDNGMAFTCDEFLTYCKKYFDTHFREIMEHDVISLPYVDENIFNTNSFLKSPFDTILITMKNWCKKNQKDGIMKGLVIYGYSLDRHLEFLRFPRDVLKNKKYYTLFEDLNETVITYNPVEEKILLIKRAKSKLLEEEMESSVSDLIKFVIIYHKIFQGSRITLINLLATDQAVDSYPWKCKSCKSQVIPLESLESIQLFEQWLKTKSFCNNMYCFKRDGRSQEDNIKKFSCDFSAYILGFLAHFQSTTGRHFQGMLPSLTNNPENQIEESVIILPEQLKIVNSTDTRLIIKGCHGSGISIVARKRAEVISKTLKGKEEEILYYICQDSKRQRLKEMSHQVKIFSNKKGKKLSDILDEIKSDGTKQKAHVIVELYDSEHLDDTETNKLNCLLTKDVKLKDSIVSLFCKPVEKKRLVGNDERKANMISSLVGMKIVQLEFNVRNPIEIKDFLKYTVNVLSRKEHKTTTFCLRHCDHANKLKVHLEDKTKIPEKSSVDYILTIDEALEYYVPISDKTIVDRKIESTFDHINPSKCGHSIECGMPSAYQINDQKNSDKFKVLLALVLRRITGSWKEKRSRYDTSQLKELTNGFNVEKHVILHFDVQNHIPDYLYLVFQLMGMCEKVTDDYEEFKRHDKKILICNYRAYGGYDFKRVIIVLYSSMYHLKHFLPECISYSTAFLSIIVLSKINFVENLNEEKETAKRVIDKWKGFSINECWFDLWDVEMEVYDERSYNIKKPQPADRDTPKKLTFRIGSALNLELIRRIKKISCVPDKNNQEEVMITVKR